MVYVNDGSVHRIGIENEEDLKDQLNKIYKNGTDLLNLKEYFDLNNIEDISFEHHGGTGSKSDIDIYNSCLKLATISVKNKDFNNKTNKPIGTFDIINTTFKKFNTKYNIVDKKTEDNLLTKLDDYKDSVKKNPSIVDTQLREIKADLSNETINKITDIKSIIKLAKSESNKTDFLIITRKENKKYVGFYYAHESVFEDFYNTDRNFYFESPTNPKEKESRRICYKDNKGSEIQTPFRLRVVLNNGIHAYYGLSKSNDNSSWTIKIQIDGVKDYVDRMQYYENN